MANCIYSAENSNKLNAGMLYLVTRDDVKVVSIEDFCEAYSIMNYKEYRESNGEVPSCYDTESKQKAAEYAKTMYMLKEIRKEDYQKICEKLGM